MTCPPLHVMISTSGAEQAPPTPHEIERIRQLGRARRSDADGASHADNGQVHRLDVVVRELAAAYDADETGVAELLQVVRERRLGDVEERLQVADAHLTRLPAEHIDDLHAHRIAERLADPAQRVTSVATTRPRRGRNSPARGHDAALDPAEEHSRTSMYQVHRRSQI